MNEITFEILKIIFAICSVLITVYLVPYIKAKLSDAKYENLLAVVDTAVRAAEQVFHKGEKKGPIKKAEVLKFMHEWLEKNKIKITEEQLSQLIECCVWDLNQEAK